MLLTDDVVSVLILHHPLQIAVIAVFLAPKLLCDPFLLLSCAVLNAVLHNAGCELVLGENQKLVGDIGDHLVPIIGLSVLDDMLGDVVTKLVTDQGCGMSVNFGQDEPFIVLASKLQGSLDDPASVGVESKLTDSSFEAVHDESDIFAGNQLNNLLHDMVSVLVLQDLEDFRLQLTHELGLLLDENVFKCLKYSISLGRLYLGRLGGTNLLNYSASVHLD